MESVKRRTVFWGRIVCVGVAGGLLYLVFQKIDRAALLNAFRQMSFGWYLAAFLLYGFLFIPATLRWHLALLVTGNAVRPSETAKLTVIGHFFYLIFFGGIGGDAAKAALYAKLHDKRLSEILASATLDRLMGTCGLILFLSVTFAMTLFLGNLPQHNSLSMDRPTRWILLTAVVAIIALAVYHFSRTGSPLQHFVQTLVRGIKRLASSPKILVTGVLCSFLVQTSLSGVLALNLNAVNHASVPWAKLFWIFPLITLATSLPVTVGGVGTRESVSLALFGLFGIPAEDAVAASLLSLSVSLIWSLVGAVIFWRVSLLVTKEKSTVKTRNPNVEVRKKSEIRS